jgi:hypothetical protein
LNIHDTVPVDHGAKERSPRRIHQRLEDGAAVGEDLDDPARLCLVVHVQCHVHRTGRGRRRGAWAIAQHECPVPGLEFRMHDVVAECLGTVGVVVAKSLQ